MGEQVFAAISALYVLVMVGGVLAWRWDREQCNRAAAEAVDKVREEAHARNEKLKAQLKAANGRLREETEARRTLEGNVVIEDILLVDPLWGDEMSWAAEALAANDPTGA